MKRIRVLIVEDSAVVREHLRRIVSADPRLMVAGMASSGEEALAMVDQTAPDVISMDIQLPGIEGFETTRQIMSYRPTPIVVVSGVGIEEVSLSMQALKSGALGVVQKPVSSTHEDYAEMAQRLCTQLVIMSEVKVIRRREIGHAPAEVKIAKPLPSTRIASGPYRVLAVAASTGGPNALMQLLTGLGPNFPLPVVVVQHMTLGFMDGFAEWLASVTPFAVSVVTEQTHLLPGNVYLGASDRHLIVESGVASLDYGPPVGNHRPSANILFSSLARNCGGSVIGVILTGMGEDGAAGLSDLRSAGAFTIAEDDTTAVVYGMPAAGMRLGAVLESLPLHGIAPRILELVAPRPRGRA